MVNLPWRDPRYTNGIDVLKRAENPSKTMNATSRNAENAALVSESARKDRHQTLAQILRLHTSQRRRLREYIRRKRPQFWQKDDRYLLHDNASVHRSQLVKQFHAKIRTGMLPHSPYSPDLAPCNFYLFPSTNKHLQGRRFVLSDYMKVTSQEDIREVEKNGFQSCFHKLYELWQKCIVTQRKYLEGGCASVR
ncbi:mariner Mos1 transposase [Trichonephila clavipes]|nr:mariner Mos1 transposase [Trichonephila clavipes]